MGDPHRTLRGRGFTLVEAIVSLGLFSLLVLLVTTSFFYLTNVQRTIESKQQILNDFRFALDVMVKEMTSGSGFPAGCESGCTGIVFLTRSRPDMLARAIHYQLNTTTNTIEKAAQTHGLCATMPPTPFNSNCFQPFHSDDIAVTSLKFYVQNRSVAYTQLAVTIQITGVIKPGSREEEQFSITTTVTPRLLQDPNS